MANVIITTLGFDVKFQMRTLARLGKEYDKLIIIAPHDGEKTEKAIEELEVFAREILGLEVKKIRVDPLNLTDALHTLASMLTSIGSGEVLADLSGGMRVLILETLASLLASIDPYRLKIIVWTEDLRGRVEFDPITFNPPSIDYLERRILESIEEMGGTTLSDLSRSLGIAKSTLHKKLSALSALGLIEAKPRGRRILYTMTEKGRVALALSVKKY